LTADITGAARGKAKGETEKAKRGGKHILREVVSASLEIQSTARRTLKNRRRRLFEKCVSVL
jgi:hypothetical protein